jgi:hypothetical protein
VVVVIFHDHGTRYVGKMFNDDWMRERGFLVEEKPTAGDLLKGKDLALVSVEADEPVLLAIDRMRKHNIDQLPVMEGGKPVGTITDARLFDAILEDAEVRHQKVRVVMGPALPCDGLAAKKLGNGQLVKMKEGLDHYGDIIVMEKSWAMAHSQARRAVLAVKMNAPRTLLGIFCGIMLTKQDIIGKIEWARALTKVASPPGEKRLAR